MKKLFSLKNIVLIVAGGLAAFVLILAVFIVTFDDDDYRRLLIRWVDFSSDYRLEISGPFHFSLSTTPELSATNIELKSKIPGDNISLQKFEVKMTLAPLLDGILQIDRLQITNMVAQIADPSAKETDFTLSPGRFRPAPVLKSVAITHVVVEVGSEKDRYILNHLNIDDINDQGPLLVDAEGSINDKTFSIKGQLGSLRKLFTRQPYPVDIKLSTPLLTASLQGQIADALNANGLDLQLKFEAADLRELIHPDFPDSSRLSGSGRLLGDLYQPELSALNVTLTRDKLVKITTVGRIADIMTGTGADITLNGVIKDPDISALLFSDSMPKFNDISFKASLIKYGETIRLSDIKARLSDPLGLQTTLVGSMDLDLDAVPIIKSMAISATINSETTVAAQPLLVDLLPEMGPVSGKAIINAADQDLAIEDIDIVVGAGQAVNLQIKGRIGKVPLDPDTPNSDIALDLNLKADRTRSIGTLLQHDLPDIGPVEVSGRFTSDSADGRFDKLQLTAGDPNSLSVSAEGYIQLLNTNTDPVSLNSLINIRTESTSLGKASRLLGFDLPDLGPVKASMVVKSDAGNFSGHDIGISIGRQKTLQLNLAGSIGKLPLTSDPVSGIKLNGSVQVRSTSALSMLTSDRKIPDIGPLSGRFTIRGNATAVSIDAIKINAGRKDKLSTSVRGKIGHVEFGSKQIKGMNITLTAAAPTSSALSDLLGQEVIDMGPFKLIAQIDSDRNLIQLNNLDILVGSREDPAMTASGSVKNLLEVSGIAINIPFNERILYPFLAKTPKDPVPLNGNILLSDADGSFGIETLTLESEQSNLIAVKVHGGIDDIMHGDEINIDASISIEDLKRLGDIFNMDLPALGPIKLLGKLTGSNEKAGFDGRFKFNQTEVTSKLILLNFDEQPAVKGSLYIPVLHLQDFGIRAEAQKRNQHAQAVKQKGASFFSRTPIAFDRLHNMDLDIKVDIDEVEGSEFALDTVDMDILLNKGVLRVESAKFRYAGGQINANASIEADRLPRLKLNLAGDDISLKGLLQQTQIPSPIEGDLNLVLDLSSSGVSAHEIASNLNGGIGLTLENGIIRRREIDALLLDFVDWLFTFGVSKNEMQINCAIVHYKIKQGMMDTELFYLDGPKITVRGKGAVDLAAEHLDVVFNLEKKRFLINSRVPIHIRGKLTDPTVLAIPYRQALLIAGVYIFAPFVAIPAGALGAVGMLLFEPGDESRCQEKVAEH